MIAHPFKHFVTVCLGASVLSGCVLNQLGTPPRGPTDIWQKAGYSRSDIYAAVLTCGQESAGNSDGYKKTEIEHFCMLRAGYKYVDGHPPHKLCIQKKNDPWANTPGCRSLRGELIVALDESASVPPLPVNKSPSEDAYKPAIPIAPSTPPDKRLQDRVQQDNNRQMNNLLRSNVGR